jgi:hypothetical protein
VVLAPTDLSLLVAALTPCSVVAGHRSSTPAFATRVAEGNRFYYGADVTPEWRRGYLRQWGVSFVLLPPGGAPMLGGDPPYVRRLALPLLEVWQAP